MPIPALGRRIGAPGESKFPALLSSVMSTAVADDPTMSLIRSLDDPTRFVRKDHVAVFKAHERHFPETKVGDRIIPARTVKVTDEDLEEIAANINAAYERDGELVKLTIGHRRMTLPGFPEDAQPRVVGYARKYKCELVNRPGGRQLRLTHTEYIRRDATDVLSGQYPGRSADYDPDDKTITGVALLTRDPALTLGTVSYDSGKLTYSAETLMADDNEEEKFTPDEEKQYAKMCRYMKRKYAKLRQYMDEPTATNTDTPKEYQVGDGSKNQGGQFRGMQAHSPAEKDKDGDIIGYPRGKGSNIPHQGDRNVATYENLPIDEKVRELEEALATERRARVEESCKRLLEPLRTAVKFNYERELKVLCQYATDTERAAHVDDMLANREKLPTGKMIPVGPVPKPGAADAPLTQDEMKAALQYQSEKNVDWDAAMAHVKGQRK